MVERNVLEWRVDPDSSSRLPVAKDHDIQVIFFCSEGYTSSAAASALQDLGLWRATLLWLVDLRQCNRFCACNDCNRYADRFALFVR